MPYQSNFVEPDVFHRYNGVTVYYTYTNGEADDRSDNYLTTNFEDADSGENQFDVRKLPTFDPKHPPYLTGENDTEENSQLWVKYREDDVEHKEKVRVIELAIDNGILKNTDEQD